MMIQHSDAPLFRVRPADLGLIVLILGLMLFGIVRGHARAGGEQAVVLCDGRLIKELPLTSDGLVRIPGEMGPLTLEVRNHSVRIVAAGCPRGLCRHSGWIHGSGEAIVCVPNKISVVIRSGQEGRYDAVTY